MAKETGVKTVHSEERKEPYNTLNRINNIVQELSQKMAKGKARNTLTRRSPIKVVKRKKKKEEKEKRRKRKKEEKKKKKKETESPKTDSLVKEDISKVPERSAH